MTGKGGDTCVKKKGPPAKSYEMDLPNYELKHLTWTNSQKRQTRCKIFKIPNEDTHMYHETINVFLNNFTGVLNFFNCIQGNFPYPMNGY